MAWIQFNIRFYVFALIFIIFDVRSSSFLPWAVVFKSLGPVRFHRRADFLSGSCCRPGLRVAQGGPGVGPARDLKEMTEPVSAVVQP